MYKFYDTCSLIENAENLFSDPKVRVVISSISLQELENIKTSRNKDDQVKYAARYLLRQFQKNPDGFELVIYKDKYEKYIKKYDLVVANDTKIIACAYEWYRKNKKEDFYFITNDLACYHLARLYFSKEQITTIKHKKESYNGYIEKYLDTDELAKFYTDLHFNSFGLLINQYLIIYDKETGELVDRLRWDGSTHKQLNYCSLSSRQIGDIKPMKKDPYQALVVDSFNNNKITMVKGPAGSGKTILSLGYLFNQLEKGKIDRIIIFCNTVATKNSARLGFYPGTRDEKLLDSQIGNLLSSKMGGRYPVEQLIQQDKLVLLPFSDIRGYDTSGMKAGIYISEAQNLDISLMKLALQRIGEDCLCIIDGDEAAQVDLAEYEGANNGMRRTSKIFRGADFYGEITLKTVHRSRIADLAQKL